MRFSPLALCLLLFVSLAGFGGLAGCRGSRPAPAPAPLVVTGQVVLPDSTVLFGAEISTEPTTGYVSTDEDGRFWMTLPRPDAYTFIATHPDGRFRDLEGRVTDVQVFDGFAPHVLIMLGRTQRMPLMDVDERATPAFRRGKKRTG